MQPNLSPLLREPERASSRPVGRILKVALALTLLGMAVSIAKFAARMPELRTGGDGLLSNLDQPAFYRIPPEYHDELRGDLTFFLLPPAWIAVVVSRGDEEWT